MKVLKGLCCMINVMCVWFDDLWVGAWTLCLRDLDVIFKEVLQTVWLPPSRCG